MHRQICVCLGVVCVTVALTTPVRGQYGNPYALEPMQPYDYGEPDTFMDDYYERKDRTQRWQDRQRALQDDYAKPPAACPVLGLRGALRFYDGQRGGPAALL